MKKMRRSSLLESVMLVAGIVASGSVAYSQTAAAPAQTQQPPPASLSPAMPVLTDAPADPAKLAEPAGTKPPNAPVPDTFVLGVEDQITVSMWDEPKFDGAYTIRPDGKIMVKLLGEIDAAGLTPMQLCDVIDKAARKMLTTPRCTVNVIGVHSRHIYFDGEGIAQPGPMDLVIPIHLLEAISARGGFRDFADKKHIKILRDGKVFITVNYKDLVSGKHSELNISLQDKDHVVVN